MSMATTKAATPAAVPTPPHDHIMKIGGFMWNPDLVWWGARGKAAANMPGYHPKKDSAGRLTLDEVEQRKTNFWDVQAVYALHFENELVYIGEGKLGDRITLHRNNVENIGLWDSFTWLSPMDLVKDNDKWGLRGWDTTLTFNLNLKALIELFELVTIRLALPIGNSQKPDNKTNIKWIKQLTHPLADKTVDQRFDELSNTLLQSDKDIRAELGELKALFTQMKGKSPAGK